MEDLAINTEFWRERSVFLTGHTGFKGGWIAHWLVHLGARVHGFSLAPSTTPNFYTETKLSALLETSKILAEALPEYAKKLPKKTLPNFMVKFISMLDSSAKTMIPDLELEMKPETKYAEELIGFEFKPASGALIDAGKSVVRLGLV